MMTNALKTNRVNIHTLSLVWHEQCRYDCIMVKCASTWHLCHFFLPVFLIALHSKCPFPFLYWKYDEIAKVYNENLWFDYNKINANMK